MRARAMVRPATGFSQSKTSGCRQHVRSDEADIDEIDAQLRGMLESFHGTLTHWRPNHMEQRA